MPEELPSSPEPVPETGHDHDHDHEYPHEHEGDGVLDTTSKCGNKCADCLACKKPIEQGRRVVRPDSTVIPAKSNNVHENKIGREAVGSL